MEAFIDLSGQRFGLLVVLPEYNVRGPAYGQTDWHCRCDCGREIWTSGAALRRGQVKSCGCRLRKVTVVGQCANGHPHAEYRRRKANGRYYCTACKLESARRRRRERRVERVTWPMAIYGLAEPNQPWNIRYIGAARYVLRRIAWHLANAQNSRPTYQNSPLYAWLRDLEPREQLPVLIILDRASPGEDWRQLEEFHIAAHEQAGFALLNTALCGQPQPRRRRLG